MRALGQQSDLSALEAARGAEKPVFGPKDHVSDSARIARKTARYPKPTGVEPNPIYHDELQRLRSCELLPTCASTSTEEVELTLPTDQWIGALGGINGGRMREYAKQISPHQGASVVKRLRCVRVGDELRRLGVRHVDLFSLDVEGHERAVLDGIDVCRRGLRLDPACMR